MYSVQKYQSTLFNLRFCTSEKSKILCSEGLTAINAQEIVFPILGKTIIFTETANSNFMRKMAIYHLKVISRLRKLTEKVLEIIQF
jgi:hypothetical protein